MEQNNYNNIQQQPQYQQQPYCGNQPPVQYIPVYYPEYQYVPVGKPSIMNRWFNFVSRRKHVMSKIFWHITLTPVIAILVSLPWILKGAVWLFCLCFGLCFLSSR